MTQNDITAKQIEVAAALFKAACLAGKNTKKDYVIRLRKGDANYIYAALLQSAMVHKSYDVENDGAIATH